MRTGKALARFRLPNSAAEPTDCRLGFLARCALSPKIFPLIRIERQQQALEEKMQKTAMASSSRPATYDDVRSILGNLDETKMQPILALRPTVSDVEEASIWLGGDADIFEAAEPLGATASEIVTILTADEDEEPRRVG